MVIYIVTSSELNPTSEISPALKNNCIDANFLHTPQFLVALSKLLRVHRSLYLWEWIRLANGGSANRVEGICAGCY